MGKKLNPGPWVMGVLRDGYKIEFTADPPMYNLNNETEIPTDPAKREILEQELEALLSNKAAEKVPAQQCLPLFRSRFFLAPKKQGLWRPILNLRPLNKRYVRPKRFRMETLSLVIPLLRKGMWATSIDLKDAYLHVPINPADRRFLAFRYKGVDYQFRSLPFGLSTAPRVFTRMTCPILAHLRKRGINVFAYLDDWLVVAETELKASHRTDEVVSLLRDLGWVINLEKSILRPTQSITYLGAILDLAQGLVFPTSERIANLTQSAESILNNPESTARTWLRLLGLMASLVDVLKLCRLRMRPLQRYLLSCYKPAMDATTTAVPFQKELKPFLLWWTDPRNVTARRPFQETRPKTTITTDASLTGWGATWNDQICSGQWSGIEKTQHINLLETEAVFRAIQHWATQLQGHVVTVLSDNTTTVAYINKEGGTRSAGLLDKIWGLLLLSERHHILLQASHLAGKQNVRADALSRLDPNEWTLSQAWANQLFEIYQRPFVDLFATADNARLPTFCSRWFHPEAWKVDAFSFPWTELEVYAFPPWSQIHRVLVTLREEDAVMILIAPCWPMRPWFPLLLELLIDLPLRLPESRTLLTQKKGQLWYHDPLHLHLSAWKISGSASRQREFHDRLLSWQPVPAGLPQLKLTITDSTGFDHGQQTTVVIPWKQL